MAASSQTHTAEHRLVARVFQAADQSNARRVLLASPYEGDGKSHLARCILRHSSVVTEEPSEVLALGAVESSQDKKGYLWFDGLALLEGEGASALTPSIRASLDGAIVVVRGMATTRDELADCAERLQVLGLPLLGGVWNERDHPPADEVLSDLKSALRKWPSRRRPGFLNRQTRSSA